MDEQPKVANTSKWPVIAILSLVVIAGVAYAMNQSNKTDQILGPETPEIEMQDNPSPEANDQMQDGTPPEVTDPMFETSEAMNEGDAEGVVSFDVSGDNFTFDVTEMRVKVGDTVRVTFNNAEGTHDWVIDEFNARTAILEAGQSETVEFVATTAGTYEYYCSVGTHRAMGMVGNLIVE